MAYTYTREIPAMFTNHYSTQRHYGSHILRFFSPLVTVQNTICSSTQSCSPEDGHNDAQNMLDRRLTINIRLVASCWFLSLHPTHNYIGSFDSSDVIAYMDSMAYGKCI